MAPLKGTRVVVDHNMWAYFLARFGLVQAASVEERPGIPASPAHLARIIQLIKDERIKVIMTLPWGDRKLAERIGQEGGAKVVLMAPAVGGVKGVDGYIDDRELQRDDAGAGAESRP